MWLDQKHGIRARRRCRKLRVAVDAQSQEIIASDLTRDNIGDVTALPNLLDQVDWPVAAVIADDAYDGQPVYDAVAVRHPEADVIIPPRLTAVPTETAASQRDRHIRVIEEHGRRGWQRRTGYGRRNLVETAMFRYKTIIGQSLHARALPNQQTEVKIRCNILNRMTSLGMPASVRIK